MRIFSKKAFSIGPGVAHGSTSVEAFVTVPNSFQDMPDKYKDDPMFKLAVSAGDIEIVGSRSQEIKAEDRAHHAAPDPSQDAPKMDAAKAFYEELKVMKKEDTAALAEKLGVDPVDGETNGQFKKRIFEAWKLANNEGDTGNKDAE